MYQAHGVHGVGLQDFCCMFYMCCRSLAGQLWIHAACQRGIWQVGVWAVCRQRLGSSFRVLWGPMRSMTGTCLQLHVIRKQEQDQAMCPHTREIWHKPCLRVAMEVWCMSDASCTCRQQATGAGGPTTGQRWLKAPAECTTFLRQFHHKQQSGLFHHRLTSPR